MGSGGAIGKLSHGLILTEAEAALIELEKKRLVVHLPVAVAGVKVEAEVRPYRDTRARAV